MARGSLFDPVSTKPFALSRSKVDLYIQCPRCFVLDRRYGVARPPGFPFNLNSAVDILLKAEFDSYRERGEPHPLMTAAGIDAVPAMHPELNSWRENFKGIRVGHEATGFELFGAVDDLWRDRATGELIVVDYKATSKAGEVSLDANWQDGYRRQMEFYQWLLRARGEKVSSRGWFVYCNGRRDRPSFNARLDFHIKLLPYDGDGGWIEPTLRAARAALEGSAIPPSADDCDFCRYVKKASATGPTRSD